MSIHAYHLLKDHYAAASSAAEVADVNSSRFIPKHSALDRVSTESGQLRGERTNPDCVLCQQQKDRVGSFRVLSDAYGSIPFWTVIFTATVQESLLLLLSLSKIFDATSCGFLDVFHNPFV
ncbi:hypothetical protein SADUNF_Sadunf06G0077100 [Salix dunnii]|uniref:Uncharacterized protein n=1 Tax=Salix dunnii TaxID=1413687 RepID=A0A835K808_9ROSI|nr:hypothetical protein SADUNF_Sadunf06G0077100 [Salix dunnii]